MKLDYRYSALQLQSRNIRHLSPEVADFFRGGKIPPGPQGPQRL